MAGCEVVRIEVPPVGCLGFGLARHKPMFQSWLCSFGPFKNGAVRLQPRGGVQGGFLRESGGANEQIRCPPKGQSSWLAALWKRRRGPWDIRALAPASRQVIIIYRIQATIKHIHQIHGCIYAAWAAEDYSIHCQKGERVVGTKFINLLYGSPRFRIQQINVTRICICMCIYIYIYLYICIHTCMYTYVLIKLKY